LKEIFNRVWRNRENEKDLLIALYLYHQGLGRYPFLSERSKEFLSSGLAVKKGSRFFLTPLGSSLAYHLLECINQVEKGELEMVFCQMRIGPGSVVADIGCGGGQTLFALKKYLPQKVFGVDRDPNSLRFAEYLFSQSNISPERYHFLSADVEKCPLPENSFTHLICRLVLHKLRVVNNLKRFGQALTPDGYLYLMVPNRRYYFFRLRLMLRKPFWFFYFLYVFANGWLFTISGCQLTIRLGRRRLSEIFFTPASLKRALHQSNFQIERLWSRSSSRKGATALEVIARKKMRL